VLVVPTATLPKLRLDGETVTGTMPVPASVTTCGLLLAVSVIVIFPPEVAPTVVGWKKTTNVQLAPGATGTPPVQGEITLGVTTKGPVGIIEVKLRLTAWLFVTVTVCDVLSQPTAKLPKSRLVGEIVTGDIPVPVPDSVTVCGLLLASVLIVNVPGSAPDAVGAKATPIEQLAPGASVPGLGQVVPEATSVYPDDTASELIFSVTKLCSFIRPTTLVALVVFTATLPKLNAVVDSAVGTTPFPLNAAVSVELGELVVTVNVLSCEPVAVGAKVTPTVQLAPAASEPEQVVDGSMAYAVPVVTLTVPMVSALDRLFLKVNALTALVVLVDTLP